MKQFVRIIALLVITFSNFVFAQAQDVIHRKNGKTVEAKVLEVGEEEVKYKLFTQPEGVTYVMDASLIKKIVFANGTVQKFEAGGSIDNPEYYEGQNKSAYKISFLAWTTGYTNLIYERNLKPGVSFEAKLGIIGAGRNESLYTSSNSKAKVNQRGILLGLGYKFTHKPDYYSSRQHYAHLLKGGYIRPEFNFASYGEDYYTYTTTTSSSPSANRRLTTYGCIMLCAGKQWVFDNTFAVDFSFGIGTGFVNRSKNTTSTGYDYEGLANTKYGNNIFNNNLAISTGLNIGFLGK